LLKVINKVLFSFNWKQAPVVVHTHKTINLNLPEGFTLACFDGAAQAGNCGAGGFFKSHHSRITKWFFSCGGGTNTKAELLGLWTTLHLANLWSIKHIMVLGDSRARLDN
jgi:hypothetical protein